MKNPLTLAEIEPATFRFVAQHLNHCATAVPNRHYSTNGYLCCNEIESGKAILPTGFNATRGDAFVLSRLKKTDKPSNIHVYTLY
jgi:hypothetical protein